MRWRRWGTALAVTGLLGLPAAALGAAAPAGATAPARPGEDIRDIHGPIAAPVRGPVWPYLAGAGIAAALAGGFALYKRRRPRPLTPAARALLALDEARSLAGSDARGFSFAVSEVVRRYLEEQFPLRAAHRTTEELLRDLMRDDSPVAPHRAALGDFLACCDLAKFAGWTLSPTEMASMLASAETFVRATSSTPAPQTTTFRLDGARQGTSA
jgi:hypothetical protein